MTAAPAIALFRRRGEPTPDEIKAGNYPKRRMPWRGLTARIENEAGSIRRGVKPDGTTWEVRMLFPYGYFELSEGVDGDEVDVFFGPNLDAPFVYVIHQRKVRDWSKYDEDKTMVGFDSEDDAKAAFLSCYDDPRFLGPITTMPADEFEEKVKATRGSPAMIKSVVLFVKGFVKPYSYIRENRPVHVPAHSTRRPSRGPFGDGRQLVLFGHKAPTVPPFNPDVAAHPEKHTVDMFTGKTEVESEPEKTKRFYVTVVRAAGTPSQKVGYLAGPFDTHEEALRHVEPARAAASKIDPFTDFDAFGTASREALEHRHGVLNRHLGISS